MSYKQEIEFNEVLTTTDATQTTVVTIPIPTDSVALIGYHVVGRDTSSGDIFAVYDDIVVKNVSDTVTQVGSTEHLITTHADASLATASVDIVISVTDLLIKVTGIADTTIDWMVDGRGWIN